MKVIHDLSAWRALRAQLPGGVGLVPTMGALHSGHASLVERARAENDHVVVSIFINPTQFDDPGDLAAYPSTLEADCRLLEPLGADVVLAPSAADMYPQGYRYRVSESELSQRLCGAHRPGHFDGMLTVVLKLFGLVQPQRAYFGEKDYQQLKLVEGMAADFFLPLTIVPCATVREPDGLAKSSRNQRLGPEDRRLAPQLAEILKSSASPQQAREALEQRGFEVDYVEDWQGRRLAAARLGSVRLIDNLEVP